MPVAEATSALERIGRAHGLRLGLGLGHGIGVDRDLPTLTKLDPGVFEEDQVVSVHPNYEDEDAGVAGVVADAFHVKAGGCEQLSGLRYELTVL